MNNLIPKQKVPPLNLSLLNGQPWSADQKNELSTLLIVYRGLHCPICKSYLSDFQEVQQDLGELGVEIVAVSADSRERAEKASKDWGVEKLTIGFGLSEAQMHRWGLFVSKSIKEAEPKLFAEPGLFLINPDRTLFYAAYNSMPFGRPPASDIVKMIGFVKEKDYPARGEVREAEKAVM